MRCLPLTLVVCLGGCGGPPAGQAGNSAAAPAPGEPDRRIECRLGNTGEFERICAVETADRAAGRLLVVRKPDGGFRRLLAAPDGTIGAADGAEQAEATPMPDGRIEVSIGGDSFRLPRAADLR